MRDHFVTLRNAARKCRVQLTAGLAAATLCGGLLTQAAVADGATAKTTTPSGPTPVSWSGLNWGLGIAADFDIGGTRVASASIVNGIVRLNDTSSNVGVSFVLEAHYFLRDKPLMSPYAGPGECSGKAYAKDPGFINCTEMASGPFVAIEVGGGSTATPANAGPVTAYALGWMVGFHHPKFDDKGNPVADNTSWNLGIGLRVDPKAQILGDGFAPNVAPPAGETAIRYKTQPRAGLMLMSSFSF